MGSASRSPVAVRVIRPHTTLEEFYGTDLGTITTSTIVLLGAQKRPEGIVLRFEVVLADGSPIIRGEGRVIGYMDRTPLGEPGLCLKLIRVDPRSKEVLDEVLSRKEAAGIARGRESVPPAVGSIPPPSSASGALNDARAPEAETSAPASSPATSRKAPPPLPGRRGAQTRSAPRAQDPAKVPESLAPDTPINVPSLRQSEPPLAIDVNELVMLDESGNSSLPPPPETLTTAAPPAEARPTAKTPVVGTTTLTASERNARLDRLRSRLAALGPDGRDAIIAKGRPAGEPTP